MFNLDQRLDPALTALPGFDTTIHPVARRFENFELFFNLTPLDTGLRIECQYSTALFDDASIQQWLQSYAALLAGIAQDPQRPVGHLPALDAEQQALLARWNRTEHEQGLGRTPVACSTASASPSPGRRLWSMPAISSATAPCWMPATSWPAPAGIRCRPRQSRRACA